MKNIMSKFLAIIVAIISIVTITGFIPLNKDIKIGIHNFSKEYKNLNITKIAKKDYIYLNSEGGLLKDKSYKLTIDSSSLRYYGDLKNDKPHGKGILFSGDELVIGNFKNGMLNGFAVIYDVTDYGITFSDDNHCIVIKKYEGNFKNGKYDGKGNLYSVGGYSLDSVDDNMIINYCINPDADTYGYKFYDLTSTSPDDFAIISAEFKKDKISGKGKIYSGTGILRYNGNFKDDRYEGKGKLYYSDGTIKYDGEFKKGEYNGKGSLYNSDGKVERKGQWKNGDVK